MIINQEYFLKDKVKIYIPFRIRLILNFYKFIELYNYKKSIKFYKFI